MDGTPLVPVLIMSRTSGIYYVSCPTVCVLARLCLASIGTGGGGGETALPQASMPPENESPGINSVV